MAAIWAVAVLASFPVIGMFLGDVLKAIVLNLLSVGAAYGLLVLVFRGGVGSGLLGLDEAESVAAWVPLFLFAALFGLSMDYQVLLPGSSPARR